ncbi:MAG TPA: hypothetical protein GXX46_02015 [Peptococcaceae bacterium]|jgi:hypothetical protein|nr:hypothetical protein [Peptococcaceae bacterium]
MIINEYGKKRLICDNCETAADKVFDSFGEASQWRKDNGWKVSKNEQGEWINLCPECAEVK